jgi:hypothetical protein
MKVLFLLLIPLCLTACLKQGTDLPSKGAYGKICYPPGFEPPIYEIFQDKDAQKLLKDCGEIVGHPVIFGTKFKDLSFLSTVKLIEGIDIKYNPELESLHGLENIQEIKSSIVIHGNPKLKDISALKNIKKIHGNVIIHSGFDTDPGKRQILNQDTIAEVLFNVEIDELQVTTQIENSKAQVLVCKIILDPEKGKRWSCLEKFLEFTPSS